MMISTRTFCFYLFLRFLLRNYPNPSYQSDCIHHTNNNDDDNDYDDDYDILIFVYLSILTNFIFLLIYFDNLHYFIHYLI